MKEEILIVEDQFVEADFLRVMLNSAGYRITGIAHSVIRAREMIKEKKPDFILLDIFLKGELTGIDLAKELELENIPFIYLSANSNEDVLNAAKATQPYGFLVKPFRERDLLVTLEIARYRHEHSRDSILRKESILKDKLSAAFKDPGTWEEKLLLVCKALQTNVPFDYLTAGFNSLTQDSNLALSYQRTGYDEYQKIGSAELLTITRMKKSELQTIVNNTNFESSPNLLNGRELEKACIESPLHKLISKTFGVRSCLVFPVQLSQGHASNVCFYHKKSDAYTADHLMLLNNLQVLNDSSLDKIRFSYGNSVLPNGIDQTLPVSNPLCLEGIIGKSHLLLDVFDLVSQVAPTDTSVLILGESGTGKERIADSIHELSPRKTEPFVKVNCATFHPSLIESELFGHEKGSFTGASERRIGKFEKADKGTIFLDEIGEMTLDLQVKLLRVLQEKYIERIGAKEITKVNVRIIAATNRNLEKEVSEGRFRLDLYYRLNVFPVTLPPLRQRTEDIPLLANHFIQHFNHKSGKKITGISDHVLKSMSAYSWPGNIRELENVIERSVLLTKGKIIEKISIPSLNPTEPLDLHVKTINENERDHIILVLKNCNGRIWGDGGAADVLNIPPTTLTSKMKKLGIKKDNA